MHATGVFDKIHGTKMGQRQPESPACGSHAWTSLLKAGLRRLLGYHRGVSVSAKTPRPAAAAGRSSIDFQVPSRPEMVSCIRSRVGEFVRSMPFTPEQVEEIKLAVGEASTNALRHGTNPRWCRIGVKIRRLADGVKISVIDKGCGFDPKGICPPPPDSLAEGGRGIVFMRALMDDVRFHCTRTGTRVDLTKRFPH